MVVLAVLASRWADGVGLGTDFLYTVVTGWPVPGITTMFSISNATLLLTSVIALTSGVGFWFTVSDPAHVLLIDVLEAVLRFSQAFPLFIAGWAAVDKIAGGCSAEN